MQRSWFYNNVVENLEKKKQNVAKNLDKKFVCKKHKRESDHCCSDCNEVIWMDCIIEGNHVNCKKADVKATIEKYKSDLKTKLDKISEANALVHSKINFIALRRAETTINYEIRDLRVLINSIIDDWQKELQDMLASINEKTKSIQNEYMEMWEIHNEGIKIMQSDG